MHSPIFPLQPSPITQAIEKACEHRYRLQGLLGKQARRRTYVALDQNSQQKIVVKCLLFGADFHWQTFKLFEREAETLKTLSHPAIPRYLDFFEIDTASGKGFAIVQTYIEAPSLQALVTSGKRFSEANLKYIAQSLLTTLHYLHSAQPAVIHRDIKPSNILLALRADGALGNVYLVDFGAVQTTKTDGTMTVVGTYGYMPPEQFGGRAHPASDLYSLGTTLIYLATGEHPTELLQDNLQIEFEHLISLSPSFTQWLKQLTYVERSRRTTTAALALSQLTLPQATVHSQQGQPSEAPPHSHSITAKGEQHSLSHDEFRQQAEQRSLQAFQLYITDQIFEIDCPLCHVKKKEIAPRRTIQTWNIRHDMATARLLGTTLGVTLAVIQTFVPASVILTLLILSIAPLALVLLWLITPLRLLPQRKQTRASLMLSVDAKAHPQKQLSLSLIAPLANEMSQPYPIARLDALNPIAIHKVPVSVLPPTILPAPRLNKLTFELVSNQDDGIRRQITLQASQSQIEWLNRYLQHWKR